MTTVPAIKQRDREALRARIRVAMDLAIGNSPAQAHRALEDVSGAVDAAGDEIVALYFQTRAIANVKARLLVEGFGAFERSLAAARRHGEPALCARILINYGTAAVQDGDIDLAIACLEESLETSRTIERTTARNTLEKVRNLASSKPVALVSLGEALYAAGQLERAAATLHEFHSIRSGNSGDLLVAAAIGIPLGLLLGDDALLKLSYDPNLLDLAFARREQWLLGPIVEAFCFYFEFHGRRDEHDALLVKALDDLASVDNSLALAIRIGRLGPSTHLPRVSALVAAHCPETSDSVRAHRDLFDSFIASRRQTAGSAKELGLRAESAFARAGRPLARALALQAAGLASESDALLRSCGARAGSALQWSGSRIHRRLATQLTAREDEIARLAARGLTNRAIATALNLSERTVQHHCEAIFGKLGIRSRWQLTDAF
ncbi:MAG TPA: helix-turn-helix transcriptional regulator [Candidatus Tumulicola sp.]